VNNWLQFDKFEEYVSWAKSSKATSFHVKVSRALFLGLGNFFHSFVPTPPKDKKQPAVDTVLGKLTHRGLLLDPTHLHAKVETLVRQGDILRHLNEVGLLALKSRPTHWIVVSQTCTVKNDNVAILAPAHLKASFAANMQEIKPEKTSKSLDFAGVAAKNETHRFLAFLHKMTFGKKL
jgi:hypothetical protein